MACKIRFALLAVLACPSALPQAPSPKEGAPPPAEASAVRLIELLGSHQLEGRRQEAVRAALAAPGFAAVELTARLSAESSRDRLTAAGAVQADILAYLADEAAADALADLCARNEQLFCEYLERAFDYADGRVNPFALVDRVALRREPAVRQAAQLWIQRMIDFPHYRNLLAEHLAREVPSGEVAAASENAAVRLLASVPQAVWERYVAEVKLGSR